MNNYWLGKKLTDEHKKKLSESHKGKKNPNFGKKHSEERKRKISQSEKGKFVSQETREKLSKASILRGAKPPIQWKGGITPENKRIRSSIEFRLWRESVFARDNWTCQKYGTRGGKLHPHHIQNFAQFPELRFAIDNGITLSEKAHREFHKKYGSRNNTREQLQEFLNK